ncbi:hypothetical protein [Pseudomonas sp.]|uniref:hypothetical protein n=1 Tax=Pseudomonas sp. TaxID=306 RepID=UPI00289CB87C|nr:hypothetical protein [Pseudomonas sp.]
MNSVVLKTEPATVIICGKCNERVQMIIDRFATTADTQAVLQHAAQGCSIKQVTVEEAWEFGGECSCASSR